MRHKMSIPSPMDDQELIRRFEECSVGREAWTHRAHVKVAYLYLRRHGFPEALRRMRTGIKRLNACNGVEEGPTSGYHETTTHAFLHLIAATMGAYDSAFPCENADAFCDTHPQLMTKNVLRLFYSPQRRLDPRGKTEFLEPDLAPLPAVFGSSTHTSSPGGP